MPTPVGPAPRDPDDPDLWDEWYTDPDENELPPPRPFPMWMRIAAVVLLVCFIALMVFA